MNNALRLAPRIAISGVHGGGKTTLAHNSVSTLRREGINVVLATESARDSMLMWTGQVTPAMEIEILGLQIAEEMRASANAAFVVCDRSVLDTAAYTLARFPGEIGSAMVEAVCEFAKKYLSTYSKLFYVPDPVSYQTADWLRDSDQISPAAAREAFRKILSDWHIDVETITIENGTDRICEFVRRIASRRPDLGR